MLVLVTIAAILRQLLLWTSTVAAVAAAAAAGDSDNVAMLVVVAGALAFPERQKLCLDFSHSYLSARNLLPARPVPLSGQKI